MFVVKRPFKNLGKAYTAGTVITDPAVIKRFNGKLAEGKIIEVTGQTLESTAKYFKEKYGVDITPAKKSAEPKVATKPVEAKPAKTETQKKVVVATTTK